MIFLSESENVINFRVKYGNLKVSKSLDIKKSSDEESVTKYLTEIDFWINDNIYKIFKINRVILDKFIDSYGIKREHISFSSVADILSSKESKKVVSESCEGDKKLEPIARSYLIGRVLEKVKLI